MAPEFHKSHFLSQPQDAQLFSNGVLPQFPGERIGQHSVASAF
jgi:hypothetical protein